MQCWQCWRRRLALVVVLVGEEYSGSQPPTDDTITTMIIFLPHTGKQKKPVAVLLVEMNEDVSEQETGVRSPSNAPFARHLSLYLVRFQEER